ncbi:MAG: CerR family C-terminal domain-containing protein [Planctomycetota bacterium]
MKQRLIEAAMKLFTDRGPDDVSLRDIAAEAGVTHGSIRYHFGTKEDLYLTVVDRLGSVSDTLPELPPKAELERLTRKEAERQLRAMVHRFVRFQARMGADNVSAHKMLQAEISRDGGPDPLFYKRVIKPGHEHLKLIIRGVRPDIEDEEALEILAFNLIFQCVMVRIAQGIIKKRLRTRRLKHDTVERIAELIADVSIFGLRKVDV